MILEQAKLLAHPACLSKEYMTRLVSAKLSKKKI
jgi:hypothetical protein